MPLSRAPLRNAAGIAEDHETVAVEPRHRVVAALGDGLRAGRDHLAAAQDLLDGRMQLEALQLVVRIERRVLVVETDHEADVDDAVFHPVDEGAAERVHVQRIAERVDHVAGRMAIFGKLPELLHAERIDLRILARVQIEDARQLLHARAARTLGEDRHLRAHVDARLEVRLRLSELVDAFVAGADADDAAVFDEDARGRELGEEIDAHLADDRTEPAHDLAERDHVVAVILERRRHGRTGETHRPRLLGEIPELITGHRRLDRAAALEPVRHQLGDAARIHHRAGDPVRADLLPLLQDGDGDPLELLASRPAFGGSPIRCERESAPRACTQRRVPRAPRPR